MAYVSNSLDLAAAEDTVRLGEALAARLRPGDCVRLSGDLGAGKTTLARGVITALCDAEEVPSPTYTLVQTYDGPRCEIWHFDLYRLERPSDIIELGAEDALEDAICLIEWPDRGGDFIPKTAFSLSLEFIDGGEGRRAVLTGPGRWTEGEGNV